MHEVSLIESVVAIVDDQRRTHGFSRVRMIRLQVGALGHAEPAALRFCFDAVTAGTAADGAELLIDMIPGQGRCLVCRQSFGMEDRFSVCPLCGSSDVRMSTGDELRVLEIGVE